MWPFNKPTPPNRQNELLNKAVDLLARAVTEIITLRDRVSLLEDEVDLLFDTVFEEDCVDCDVADFISEDEADALLMQEMMQEPGGITIAIAN